MEMLCLQKINYMNYTTYRMKIRDLYVEELCVKKYDIFKNLVAKIFLSPFTKVHVHETTIIFKSFEFAKVSHFLD